MPHFEVYEDQAGEWRFRLRADNGEIIATSEGYKHRDSAYAGIEVMRRLAASSPVEDLTG